MKAAPAGVLYFHIHDALLKEKNRISDQDIEDKLFKKYKMKGLITADETIARLMDTSLDTGYSDIVPLALNRSGGFYKNSSVASTPAFQMLGDYLNELIVQAGLSITSGNIQLNPYQDKQTTACQFCDFKSVCQFDPILKENKFHRLSSLSEEEVFNNMEKRLEKGGDPTW